jgi:hypothetical protein
MRLDEKGWLMAENAEAVGKVSWTAKAEQCRLAGSAKRLRELGKCVQRRAVSK